MSKTNDAESRLGELFIIGFDGKTLPDDTSAFISQAGIGGIILFAQNYESPQQVAELIHQVQESRADLPLWISVDQEGGRVQRFKEGFTLVPPALQIGDKDSPKLTFEIAELIGKELKAVGVNLDFAPVADILTNPSNPVIGDRSFGRTEELTSKMVSAAVRGLLTSGVQPCVKHFPGHGDTDVDSHEGLPKVTTPLETLRDREFKPFVKASKSRCNFIMTAHIVNTSVDPDYPATLSQKFLQKILREELRYQRVIVSDDMEMGAITQNYGAEEAPVLAIQAGCDLLCYRSENAARHAYESVRKALLDGKIPASRILESAERLRSLKASTLNPYEPIDAKTVAKHVGTEEHLAKISQIS